MIYEKHISPEEATIAQASGSDECTAWRKSPVRMQGKGGTRCGQRQEQSQLCRDLGTLGSFKGLKIHHFPLCRILLRREMSP